jgi:hypothetical protein
VNFSSLSGQNQGLIIELDGLSAEGRKKRSRKYQDKTTKAWKPKQHNSDPATGRTRAAAVTVWEFDVHPNTFNAGAYRLHRRTEGASVAWYYSKHVGETSFNYEKIVGYPPPAVAAVAVAAAPPPPGPVALPKPVYSPAASPPGSPAMSPEVSPLTLSGSGQWHQLEADVAEDGPAIDNWNPN